jgi:hypothetical protein
MLGCFCFDFLMDFVTEYLFSPDAVLFFFKKHKAPPHFEVTTHHHTPMAEGSRWAGKSSVKGSKLAPASRKPQVRELARGVCGINGKIRLCADNWRLGRK